MKTLLVVFSIIALCSCKVLNNNFRASDPKDSLNQVFAGFWEQGNLTDPIYEIDCFDEETADLTMKFIGQFLMDIAKQDVVNLPKTIKNFQQNFPPATLYCMGNNTETDELKAAYKVADTPFALLEKQAITYITLHIATLHQLASTGYFYYYQGMYKPLGQLFGQVAQQMFAKTTIALPDDPKADLQNLLNGLFEQAGLSDPTTIVNCFDDTSAQVTLHFFEDVIGDLAADNYLALVREYQIYKNTLPQNVTDCIKGNQELQQVYNAYGFQNETGKTLLQKYLSFSLRHHFQLLNYTKTIDQQTEQGNWQVAGQVTGELIQGIIGSAKMAIALPDDPKADLQNLLNGLFEQAGLSDPTTIVNCFDDTSAQVTLHFFEDVIGDLAADNYLALVREYQIYKNTLPQNVTDCIKGNQELQQVYNAYGFQNETGKTLLQKYLSFSLRHHFQLLNYTKTIDQQTEQGNWQVAGQVTGELIQGIIGSAKTAIALPDDPKADLQNLLNGLFEQAGLSDPTTIVNCFDDTSAQVTLHFYEDVIGDLAADNYLALVREYQIYKNTLPQNVTDCVKGNQELQQVSNAYGFQNETGKTLLQKYLSFSLRHHFQLLNYTKTIDQQTEQGNWQVAGQVTGELIQGIIGSGKQSDVAVLDLVEKIWQMIRPLVKKTISKFHH